MDEKTVGLSDTFKGKTAPKSFTKNPIKGTKFLITLFHLLIMFLFI